MLTQIDDLTRGDHHHLDTSDVCYYFGEYTSRKSFAFSETNQLILNFKKSMEFRNKPAWRHKQGAISEVAKLYRQLVLPNGGDGVVLVPAPPSKAPGDPMFDDRMHQALTLPPNPLPFEVRRLIVQTVSRTPSHACADGERPRIDDLIRVFRIDESLTAPAPQALVICDDVITNGTTFKAMKHVLGQRFPRAQIIGVFVARRVIGADLPLFDAL